MGWVMPYLQNLPGSECSTTLLEAISKKYLWQNKLIEMILHLGIKSLEVQILYGKDL